MGTWTSAVDGPQHGPGHNQEPTDLQACCPGGAMSHAGSEQCTRSSVNSSPEKKALGIT